MPLTKQDLQKLTDEFASGMITNLAANSQNADEIDEADYARSRQVQPITSPVQDGEADTDLGQMATDEDEAIDGEANDPGPPLGSVNRLPQP